MLAFSSCLQPFQRPLGRRAELQEQVPWDEVVSASAPSRFSPRAASRGPGALGARSLALEVYLLWASRSAKSRRNARAVWCSRQRSRSGPASAIVMRNQEIESSVGAAQEEDAGEDQDTKQKLLQRLRQEVSGSHQLVARIFLSASSDLRHEMLELIAEETMALPVENFRGLLRALRKADVSPENIVQLYQRVQPWFMEQKPNEEDWAQVVYALARSGRLSEAADMVECMERGKEGFPAPDSRMYVLLVREMARQKGPFAASTLLSRTQAQGLIPDAVYFLLMVVVYSSATPPQLDRAKLYLRKGEELMRRQKFDFRMEVAEPLYLYTALMAGYSRLGRFRDTFSVLGILRQRKIRLSAVTFSILQRCCFSRLDAATDVRQLLRIMEQMGVTPETDNYNHLIEHLNLVLQGLLQLAGYTSCYGQSGQMTLALQVANRMREAGISWNQITYLKLIKAVVASGQVELALRLLTRMRSDGVRPGAPHYTCAFICLAREGYYEDASRVFQRLVELGGAKDPFAWNMMMAIECRRGDMDAAMEVLESMKEAGWPPNITSYSIMLEGYTGISDWPSALALRDTVLDLRQSLIRIAKDPVATEAAASAAKLELNLTATWTKVYHLLVDAAVYNAEWTRGVAFIEELTELGLPVNYYKHARRTVKTARQHACPTPKKRAAEPRPPPTKPPKVPEAPKPATNSPTMESDPVDHRQLFRRLLGMPRKKALKELEQLSEETLNAFAEFLDSEEAEQILCEPLVLALKDLPKPRKPRKPKARKKKSEKITKAKQKQPVNTDTPSAATAGAARPLLKGISRNRRDGSYQARICFNNFMTAAQYVNNLDVAVDIHISLVQMRQHAAASLAEGKEFGQVMHDAIEAIQKERATAGAVKLRLRFRSFFRNKFTRTEGNLDKAIQDWTRIRQEKDSFAGRVRGMEAERKQDETQKREARAARAAARMEQLRQMSERREAKLMARQRRQEALRRKRLAYARVKHGNLRTMILVLQTRFQKIRRKKMLKDWGVPELPEGLQLNSFQSADDSLCATLRLSDGTDAVGPYRKNFQEALRELQELRALQQLRGDKVLCQEMQRRDLEAMTAFFVQSIR